MYVEWHGTFIETPDVCLPNCWAGKLLAVLFCYYQRNACSWQETYVVYGISLYECVLIYPFPFWMWQPCAFFASVNGEAVYNLTHPSPLYVTLILSLVCISRSRKVLGRVFKGFHTCCWRAGGQG